MEFRDGFKIFCTLREYVGGEIGLDASIFSIQLTIDETWRTVLLSNEG